MSVKPSCEDTIYRNLKEKDGAWNRNLDHKYPELAAYRWAMARLLVVHGIFILCKFTASTIIGESCGLEVFLKKKRKGETWQVDSHGELSYLLLCPRHVLLTSHFF